MVEIWCSQWRGMIQLNACEFVAIVKVHSDFFFLKMEIYFSLAQLENLVLYGIDAAVYEWRCIAEIQLHSCMNSVAFK